MADLYGSRVKLVECHENLDVLGTFRHVAPADFPPQEEGGEKTGGINTNFVTVSHYCRLQIGREDDVSNPACRSLQPDCENLRKTEKDTTTMKKPNSKSRNERRLAQAVLPRFPSNDWRGGR